MSSITVYRGGSVWLLFSLLVLTNSCAGISGLRWLSDSEVATTRYSIGDGTAAELAVADSGFAPNQPIDKYPVLLVNSFPEYPERAMLEGLSGTVWIKSLIDVDGAPIYSKVAKYSGHPLAVGFERSALIAAMKNKFKPAIHDGKPVRVWVAFPIDFRLEHMNN